MRLRLDRSDLLDILARMAPVTKGNKSMPLLENVLIACDGNDLRISATDLAVTMMERMSDAVEVPGPAIVVRHSLLQRAVSSLGIEDLEIEVAGDEIIFPGMKIRFNVVDADNFPGLPEWEPSEFVTVNAEVTIAAVNRASVFADKDSNRFSYSAVRLKFGEESTEVLATDGKRLWSEILKTGDSSLEFSLPFFAIKPLESVCSGDVLHFGLNTERPGFAYAWADDQRRLILREWEGTFPNVNHVREQPTNRATLGSYLALIKRCMVISPEVLLSIADGRINIQSRSDFGECEATLDCAGNLDAVIRLNAQYVVDALTAIGPGIEAQVVIAQEKHMGAVFFWCEENDSRCAVVMPLRDK